MRPRRGGSLKHIGVEPPSFDPQTTVAYQTQLMSSLVRRTLFKFVNGASYGPSDFTLVPDLATRAAVGYAGTRRKLGSLVALYVALQGDDKPDDLFLTHLHRAPNPMMGRPNNRT